MIVDAPAAPAPPLVPAPPATVAPPASPPATPAVRQAIERFTLDGPCVRRARDGQARIGLRLLLAQPGAISLQVHRAAIDANAERCPKRNPDRRYDGKLRRVAALDGIAPAGCASSPLRPSADRRYVAGVAARVRASHARSICPISAG